MIAPNDARVSAYMSLNEGTSTTLIVSGGTSEPASRASLQNSSRPASSSSKTATARAPSFAIVIAMDVARLT